MANSNLKTHRRQCPDSDCELKLRCLRIWESGRIRSCNARWQILWRDPRPARRRTTITSARRPCRSSGRAPHARSPELAFDFIKRFHAAFANRRVVRVLTHMRRIIPAALAFRAVRAKDFYVKRKRVAPPHRAIKLCYLDLRHNEDCRKPRTVLI